MSTGQALVTPSLVELEFSYDGIFALDLRFSPGPL